MSEEPSTPRPDAASPAPDDDAQAPSLEDSLRRLESAGREGLENTVGTLRALRMLVAADLALAWGALGRAVAWIAVAIVFGASSWLLLMGVLIAALQSFGLSWLASMAIAAGLSLCITAFGIWQALRFLRHTRLKATRRQLRRLGLGNDEDEEADA